MNTSGALTFIQTLLASIVGGAIVGAVSIATSVMVIRSDMEALTAKADAIDAARERCKAINAAYRKQTGEPSARLLALVVAGTMTEAEAVDVAKLFSLCPYERQPYPAYHLTNMGARARQARQRIQIVKARKDHIEKAEASPRGVLIERNPASDFCRVTFAEKPARETLDALRAAGYRWTGASWVGYREKLPCEVSQLETEAVPEAAEQTD